MFYLWVAEFFLHRRVDPVKIIIPTEINFLTFKKIIPNA